MIFGSRVVSLLLFFIFWQIVASTLSLELLPSPYEVLKSLCFHIFKDELLYHLFITLYRVVVAFFIAMSLGVVLGILMGVYRRVDEYLDSLLILFLNIPALVTILLCYIWFGLSDMAAILAVVINKVPTVTITIREGAKAVNRDFMEIAKVYKIDKFTTIKTIFLPQIYPYIMASCRSGLALIWKIVLVVELLGLSNGIGYQLSIFFQFFDISSILAYSFAFIAVILAIEKFILRPLENRANKWR